MFKKLIEFDKYLFGIVNQKASNPFFDLIMPFIRQPLFWLPLYFFIILFAIYNFQKKAGIWIGSMLITVGITDSISSRVFKPLFGRLRPCNNPELSDSIRLLVDHCGQNGSFTSSHATNHFGIAVFIFITLDKVWGKFNYLFLLWAASICYAQVYVGVHFPFDVLGGAILGSSIGYAMGKYFNNKMGCIEII
jgi:membrane-associated phospholipid phosphatase